MTNNVSVVVADSLEILREGIIAKLEPIDGIQVAGEAGDGFSTLKLCRSMTPDLLMMDLDLIRPGGLETMTKVLKSCPDIKIIVLSSDATFANAYSVLSQGAFSFIPKQSKSDDLINAIQAAINGYIYLPINLLDGLIQSRKNIGRTGNAFGLSPRETEILDACHEGQSTQQIAQCLDISVRTVETHKNNIYRKTSCKDFESLKKVAMTV